MDNTCRAPAETGKEQAPDPHGKSFERILLFGGPSCYFFSMMALFATFFSCGCPFHDVGAVCLAIAAI